MDKVKDKDNTKEDDHKRTHVNEKIGPREVDHPARHEEEENSWFKHNPTTIEGS